MSKGGVSPVYLKPFHPETVRQVLKLRGQALPPKEIARRLNLKQHAVYTILKNNGQPASGRGARAIERVNARLDKDVAEKVRSYCAKHEKSVTMALNDLLRAAPL